MSSSKSAKVIKPKAKSLGKNKPKRATNPFGFFIANSLKTMKTFDKSGEAMKKASESWKQMSDAEKAPYTSLAKKDLDRYHREVSAVNANKVKRPPSNYLLFVKDFMRREAGNYSSARDAISAASREWKEMTDHQKAPYTREAATLSTKYKADKAKHDAQAGAKSPRKKVSASKVKVASLGKPKSRTRAAATKKPASKAKKTTVKARSASKARKPAVRGASKARKAAPARAASKPRAASNARKPALKARKAAPARAASKPRSVSKARKTVGKAKKAGGKK